MLKVSLKKDELLSKVKANRETHRDFFLKAQVGFRKKAIAAFEERLAAARDGKPFEVYVRLPEPVDKTSEYDRVIAMLEMTPTDAIELAADDFSKFVLDDWEWKQHAWSTNSAYVQTDDD